MQKSTCSTLCPGKAPSLYTQMRNRWIFVVVVVLLVGGGSPAQPSAVIKIQIRRCFRADFSRCSFYFPQDHRDRGTTGAANSLLGFV